MAHRIKLPEILGVRRILQGKATDIAVSLFEILVVAYEVKVQTTTHGSSHESEESVLAVGM